MKTINTEQKLTIQLWLGIFLAISGMVLLAVGLWLPPLGEIHSSVLVGYGEVSTFASGLIGVDYHYRYKEFEVRHRHKDKDIIEDE